MSAVLLAVLRPEDADVADFFAWYERDHVTGRMAMPGFLDAHRYVAADDPDLGLLIYELDSLDALSSPQYQALQAATNAATQSRMGRLRTFVRVTGTVIQEYGAAHGAAPALQVVAYAVPGDELADFDQWFRQVNAPALLATRAGQGGRLVAVSESNTGWNRVAVHRLADRAALVNPAAADRWQASSHYPVTAVDRFDRSPR